ncbi:protein of unknown function [Candidatus Methylocalor cossyra]|uniref:Uncharacterized protein n=1 Tax=Candidatus Methylocalor cossyra TaxID=3108543 RepID=A0ABM9NH04_9GAMM
MLDSGKGDGRDKAASQKKTGTSLFRRRIPTFAERSPSSVTRLDRGISLFRAFQAPPKTLGGIYTRRLRKARSLNPPPGAR